MSGTTRGTSGATTLGVRVPKYYYILWQESRPYIGTLGSNYILFGYLNPYTLNPYSTLMDPLERNPYGTRKGAISGHMGA